MAAVIIGESNAAACVVVSASVASLEKKK